MKPCALAALVVCLACSENHDGRGGSALTLDAGADGSARGTGGRSDSSASGNGGKASGGGSGSGSWIGSGGAASSGGFGGTDAGFPVGAGGSSGDAGWIDATPHDTGVRDSGALDSASDASMDHRDAPGDAGLDRAACIANHKSPGGRYRLQLHNVVMEIDPQSPCFVPDCECLFGPRSVEDGPATLTIQEYPTTAYTPPAWPGDPEVYTPISILYGSLEAPTLTLTNLEPPRDHFEEYSSSFSNASTLAPYWFPEAENPNPFRVFVATPDSVEPCGGTSGCTNLPDTVELSFDTTTWEVTLKRRFHTEGACGSEKFVTVQTGTGYLDCADE